MPSAAAPPREHTVTPVADAVILFVRLEMDVGCAQVYRIEHDFLQVAHHRRVVDFDAAVSCWAAALSSSAKSRLRSSAFSTASVLSPLRPLLDQLAELVVIHHHRSTACPVWNFTSSSACRWWVGRRHIQLVAALIQRDHAPFLHQLGIEQPCGKLSASRHSNLGRKANERRKIRPPDRPERRPLMSSVTNYSPDCWRVSTHPRRSPRTASHVDHGTRQPG